MIHSCRKSLTASSLHPETSRSPWTSAERGIGLLAALLISGNALGQQTSDQQKCINALLKDGSRVAAAQGKQNLRCVKSLGQPSTCLVDDPQGKVERKRQKTIDDVGRECGLPPTIGLTDPPNDAININSVNVESLILLLEELFGADLETALSNVRREARCQQRVYRRVQKILGAEYGIYLSCLEDTLQGGGNAFAFDDCLTGLHGIAGDPRGKIAKADLKLNRDIGRLCSGAVASGLFPGACADLDGTALAACLEAKTECIMCSIADDILGHNVDCDGFDDGLANGTCTRDTSHKCVLLESSCHTWTGECTESGASCTQDSDCADEGSNLRLATQVFSVPPLPVAGAIDIDCGDGALESDGTAPCTCKVQYFDPIPVAGYGTLCISPADMSCPRGRVDCDGGSALNWDTVSDHNIGSCAGNTDCQMQCDSYCSGLGSAYSRLESGCENFCTGGANDGDSCTQTNDCPGGTCNGPDGGQHDRICNCQCAGILPPVGLAGEIACQLPVRIYMTLPSGSPCTPPPASSAWDLGSACMPLSTSVASGTFLHANGGAATFGESANGVSLSCPDLFNSVTSGAELVGTAHDFDTPFGDLSMLMRAVCQ